MNDIYDPRPALRTMEPPKPEPLVLSRSDMAFLATFGLALLAGSALAWAVEPAFAVLVLLGGALVILESWFTALGFLNRRPAASLRGRWTVYLAALVPWIVGLGFAATLMLGLLYVSDWWS